MENIIVNLERSQSQVKRLGLEVIKTELNNLISGKQIQSVANYVIRHRYFLNLGNRYSDFWMRNA